MTDPLPGGVQRRPEPGRSETRAFLLTSALGLMLVPAAFGIALGFSIDVLSLVNANLPNALVGLGAVLPLAGLLRWFMGTGWRPLADFRASQLQFFSEIGFRLTRRRIILLAIIAGVSEELMFRGVLQTILDRQLPVAAAIALSSLVFGLLHARTVLYAIIAGAVGAYLGLLFWATGSLFVPIVTHAVYDLIALDWTRVALDRREAINPASRNRALPR